VSGYLDHNVSEEMLDWNEPIPEGVITTPLEAAHIIPHARNDDERAGDLVSPVLQFLSVYSCLLAEQNKDKEHFWTVFNMFHPGLVEGHLSPRMYGLMVAANRDAGWTIQKLEEHVQMLHRQGFIYSHYRRDTQRPWEGERVWVLPSECHAW
jgi:hypothetical protein